MLRTYPHVLCARLSTRLSFITVRSLYICCLQRVLHCRCIVQLPEQDCQVSAVRLDKQGLGFQYTPSCQAFT